MHLFQAPRDTCLGSPFFASLSVHGFHFTVYAAPIFETFWGISGPKGPETPVNGRSGRKLVGARQRSGEGVVRRNGCPEKSVFGESVSSLPP